MADPAYRRKISRQLNKGESLHALKRNLLYAHEGTVRARHIEAQTEQAWCLTLITNAVVTRSTEYYGLAVDSLRAAGRRIDDEVLAHILPGAQREHQLLRRHRGRHRRRTRAARPDRIPAAAGARHPVLSRGPGDGSAYRPRCWGDGLATACGEAIWRCRPFSSRRRKTTLSCVGAAGCRYSRISPRTCGRWSPSEMPSVGSCLAISSAVRGPGAVAVGTGRSGTQIAHTPARARERVERYRNASAKADSRCCRWPGKAFPSDGSSGRGELAMGAPLPVRG
ncbi:Tn3 family transposase [Streptosporangium roseum]|uniref:Tn3 family transposase n=1 Tax=Streptosporangium roseum TaxID=2001 RepID=UPI0033183EC2